jgi:CDP-diacylglycerol--glycerol-3-phosphate 3-phosphatidyltransferase
VSDHGPPPDRDAYLAGWSSLHGGYDARRSVAVRAWLVIGYRLARPLAVARIPPDLVTYAGVAAASAACVLAGQGGRWPVVAAACVVLSAVLDTLDGAVAVLARRASAWGYVLDSLADRVGDVLFVLALWLAGAPAPVAVGVAAVTLLYEYARARAAAGGMQDIGVVTVAERPTRVILSTVALAGAGLFPPSAAGWATGEPWAGACSEPSDSFICW